MAIFFKSTINITDYTVENNFNASLIYRRR